MRRILVATCVLALLVVSGAAAEEAVTGTVARVDPGSNVIVLSDGRMYQTQPATVITVNDEPTTITALQPGTYVVLRSATPVVYRDGQYVVLTESPSASAAAPGTVPVVTPPPAAVYREPAVAGEVVRAYTPDRTLYFSDGRKVEVRPDSRLFVNNEPAGWGDMTPGTSVVVERPGRVTTYAPVPTHGAGATDENYDVTGAPLQMP